VRDLEPGDEGVPVVPRRHAARARVAAAGTRRTGAGPRGLRPARGAARGRARTARREQLRGSQRAASPRSPEVGQVTALSEDTIFHIEVVKLLLQVAWSDEDLDPSEREQIRASAVKWGVPPADLHILMERLDQGEPLPVPNLKLLRKKPDVAISACRRL